MYGSNEKSWRCIWRSWPLAALLFVCLAAAKAHAQPTYDNPVIAGDHPDPTVVRVGKDYWAAVTTGSWAPHFTILRSSDLVNWRAVGAVFEKKPAWARGDFWAPELVEDRGRYFVYYTARRDEGPKKRGTLCVAVATASAPEGPYVDRGPLVCEIRELKNVGSIDAFFVRDEAGQPYLIWKADGNDAEPDQPTSIFAQRLSDDGTRLLGKRREIMRNTEPWERHVVEGSYVVRRGDWFYHFYSGNACCGRGCDYALGVARSRKLLGPWEKYPKNPILKANENWQCPGHGSIVATPDGRTFLLYHAYRHRADAFNVGREALLDEVTWGADGWPAINEGRGPTDVGPAPAGVTELPDEAEFFDDFKAPTLDATWKWPMFNEQSVRVELKEGKLSLVTAGATKDEWTGAVLARRTVSGDYEATVAVNARDLSPGARAGLAAYSGRNGAVGVAVGGGAVYVWRREGQKHEVLATAETPASGIINLRMRAVGGESYYFSYGSDERGWKELGGRVAGAHVEGARVALTVGGPAGSAGSFDWLKIRPKE